MSETIKEYAQAHHVPIMQDEGLEFLLRLIQENHCQYFLEIGTAIARTAIEVAKLDPEIQVVTIERDPLMIEQAKKNITECNLQNQITLLEGDALEVEIPPHSYDCIFIDAAKAQYTRFFDRTCSYLAPGGIIVSDNMEFHGLVEHPERTSNRNTKRLVRKIKEYHDFLVQNEEYETKFYSLGDGVAVTRRKDQ